MIFTAPLLPSGVGGTDWVYKGSVWESWGPSEYYAYQGRSVLSLFLEVRWAGELPPLRRLKLVGAGAIYRYIYPTPWLLLRKNSNDRLNWHWRPETLICSWSLWLGLFHMGQVREEGSQKRSSESEYFKRSRWKLNGYLWPSHRINIASFLGHKPAHIPGT